MSELPSDPADGYALGRSKAETRRLIVQHQLYGPFTRQFLTAAGVTSGMKVLDAGSGAGDVALLVAELVGPQGRVVGVDTNGEILEVARTRAAAAGWTNVAFRAGDVLALALDGGFDAVAGRAAARAGRGLDHAAAGRSRTRSPDGAQAVLDLPAGRPARTPAAPPPTTIPMVEVPDLVGMRLATAKGALADLGIRGTVRYRTTARHPAGTVISQSRRTGSSVRPNGRVTLVVAKAPPPPPTTAPPPPPTTAPQRDCDPSYPGVCLDPDAADYDCAGGSGNGPEYVDGPIRVRPPDPFDLDREGDGWGCESG